MKLKNLIIASMLSTTALFANADDMTGSNPISDFYVQLNGGAALGLVSNGDLGNKRAGTSGLFGGEIGYQFDEYFRAGISVDSLTKFSFSENTKYQRYNYSTKYKIKSLVAMVNLYYNIIDAKGFTPYITIGAGVARNKMSGTQNVNDLNEDISIPQASKNNFAFKAGLGTRYSLNKNISFDLRYQYSDLGKLKSGSSADTGPAFTGKLRAHEFIAGVAYKF